MIRVTDLDQEVFLLISKFLFININYRKRGEIANGQYVNYLKNLHINNVVSCGARCDLNKKRERDFCFLAMPSSF